jgi:iron(III) transport system permease protein
MLTVMPNRNRRLDLALLAGLVAMFVLPWYRIDGGFYGFGWLSGFPCDAGAHPPFWRSCSTESGGCR